MKKILFMLFLIFFIGCVAFKHRSNPFIMEDGIQISGFFYKNIPYYIYFPKSMNDDLIEISSKYVTVEKYEYEKELNAYRFVITEDYFSNIRFTNKRTGSNIIDIKPKAKHPPIRVELKLNQYFKSGDTISVDFKYGRGLAASVINFDVDFRLTVKEFDVVTIHKGIIRANHSIGPYLTPDQIESLKERDKKTPIIITNIIVKSINEDVKVDPLVFFVRDE
jgi:hypothetical protein